MSPDTDTTEDVDEPEDIEQESERCECQACYDPCTPHQPLNVSAVDNSLFILLRKLPEC